MATKLQIINKTLIKVGSETVTALTDDVKPLRILNTIYDDIVKEELQKHNWIFAKKRSVLYSTALLDSVDGFVALSLTAVDVFKVGPNAIGIKAKSTGEQGNNIVLRCTNSNIVFSGPTLTGGGVGSYATGTMTLKAPFNEGDIVSIGDTTLVAGKDFVIGSKVDGRFSAELSMPTDLLLLLEIEDFNALSTFPYQYGAYKQYDVAGKKIYCNKDIIVIYYTAVVEESGFDFNFVNCLCCRLAYELADVLTQDDQKKQTWMQEYLLAVRDAKKVNAIQLPNASLGSGVLERARVF